MSSCSSPHSPIKTERPRAAKDGGPASQRPRAAAQAAGAHTQQRDTLVAASQRTQSKHTPTGRARKATGQTRHTGSARPGGRKQAVNAPSRNTPQQRALLDRARTSQRAIMGGLSRLTESGFYQGSRKPRLSEIVWARLCDCRLPLRRVFCILSAK
jgi:hypothetical protein